MQLTPISGNNANNFVSQANINQIKTEDQAKDANLSDQKIKSLKRNGSIECKTCAERKYQDGSNEMVSFKSASHISPEAAAGKVRAHEQEHVANAYDKAKQKDGKVISANVSIHTSTCPECGRTYVSGGETTTQIKYAEQNPYSKNAQSADQTFLLGKFVDYKI